MVGYFLAGPTASGKTAVAQWLASQGGTEILSADSMLIYRGMDIGTAKPPPCERDGISYYGIDLVSPHETFNVWLYREQALASLADMERRGKHAIVVGGTGLYIKILTHGLADVPGPDPDVRAHWEQVLVQEGVVALQTALRTQSPALYAAIDDADNGRRLIRYLEWAAAGLQEAPADWSRRPPTAPIPALDIEPEVLKSRIEQRVRAMYGQGLLEEVEGLLSSDVPMSDTARQAIGYAEAIRVIEGAASAEEAIERTAARTRRLAKRQRTWLRSQADVRWVDAGPGRTVEQIARSVQAHWDQYGPTAIAG